RSVVTRAAAVWSWRTCPSAGGGAPGLSVDTEKAARPGLFDRSLARSSSAFLAAATVGAGGRGNVQVVATAAPPGSSHKWTGPSNSHCHGLTQTRSLSSVVVPGPSNAGWTLTPRARAVAPVAVWVNSRWTSHWSATFGGDLGGGGGMGQS